MKKAYIIITLLTIFALCSPKAIQAEGMDLAVSPPIIQIDLTPPAKIQVEKTITLENKGKDVLRLTPVIRGFEPALSEDGKITFTPSNKEIVGVNPEILDNLSILEGENIIDEINLAPGQKKELDIKLNIPKNEPPSDYYFALIFLNQVNQDIDHGDDTFTQAKGGVGINILLSVGPKSASIGTLKEFSTPFFAEKGPVPFTIKLQNNSKHYITPKSEITIKNMFGQIIGQVELLPVNILSNSVRSLPSKEQFILASQALECAQDKKKCEQYSIDEKQLELGLKGDQKAFWNENFLLGPYTATITIALSDQGPIIVKNAHFFAFPTYLIIGIIITVIIIIFIRNRLRLRELK